MPDEHVRNELLENDERLDALLLLIQQLLGASGQAGIARRIKLKASKKSVDLAQVRRRGHGWEITISDRLLYLPAAESIVGLVLAHELGHVLRWHRDTSITAVVFAGTVVLMSILDFLLFPLFSMRSFLLFLALIAVLASEGAVLHHRFERLAPAALAEGSRRAAEQSI